MLSYIEFGSHMWHCIIDSHGRVKQDFDDELFDRLNYEVSCWLPTTETSSEYSDTSPQPPNDDAWDQARATGIASIILYFRANQIQILVSRPLLFSLENIV